MELDATDWKILRELQRLNTPEEGRLTNVELASRVGLSPPPCLRRVQALEKAGVIAGYRALLDAAALGFEVTLFAFVGLRSQAEAELRAFTAVVAAWPLVREAYAISGEADFLLKCVARDLPSLQTFIIRDLTAAPNVENVKTTLMLRVAKYEPGVPIT
jgi:DNA-binding Lrp family transcriptional regulator